LGRKRKRKKKRRPTVRRLFRQRWSSEVKMTMKERKIHSNFRC
jgi:hypothetical protein